MPTLRSQPRVGAAGGTNYHSNLYQQQQHHQDRKPERKRKGSNAARNHFVAAASEFVGTFLFLYLAFLGHLTAASTEPSFAGIGAGPSNQQVVFVSLSYGFSLLVSAWTLYRVSGGLFNPAVTLGLVVAGALPPIRGLLLFPAQVLGAMCAAGLVSAMVPGNISTVETTLAPGVSVVQGLFLEMFLTAQLVLTILVLAAEKSKDTFLAPIGIGLALFICEIAGVYYTGASLNPARSSGPCVAATNFQTYHWIYWIGPFMGGLLAAGFYRFLLWMNEGDLGAANPGQDSADGGFIPPDQRVESKDEEIGQAAPRGSARSPRRSQGYERPAQGWGANGATEMDDRSANTNRRYL